MKKDRQLVILLAALLVLIFLSSCAAGKNASMTPAPTDFAYAEDDSYTRDAPAEEPQAEAPMANEYKAETGGAMGEMSFDDTAEAEEAHPADAAGRRSDCDSVGTEKDEGADEPVHHRALRKGRQAGKGKEGLT